MGLLCKYEEIEIESKLEEDSTLNTLAVRPSFDCVLYLKNLEIGFHYAGLRMMFCLQKRTR